MFGTQRYERGVHTGTTFPSTTLQPSVRLTRSRYAAQILRCCSQFYLGHDSDFKLDANIMDDSCSGTYFSLTLPTRATIAQGKPVTPRFVEVERAAGRRTRSSSAKDNGAPATECFSATKRNFAVSRGRLRRNTSRCAQDPASINLN